MQLCLGAGIDLRCVPRRDTLRGSRARAPLLRAMLDADPNSEHTLLQSHNEIAPSAEERPSEALGRIVKRLEDQPQAKRHPAKDAVPLL